MKIRKSLYAWLVLLALLLTSCGSSTSSTSNTTSNTTSTPTPVLGNNLVKSVTVATQSGDFHTPLDSTPDLNAANIYFTADGPRGSGVFRVAAAGGAATEVYTGKPFVSPRGIAFSPDGQHLYVADPDAGTKGQIFMLASDGSSLTPVHGSMGTAPQNMDVVIENGQQVIYFTGQEPGSQQPAVFKLSAQGAAAPLVVAKGTPFVAPDGVAATGSGVVYVSDRFASGSDMGKVCLTSIK